jgi:hypothetical protein
MAPFIDISRRVNYNAYDNYNVQTRNESKRVNGHQHAPFQEKR